METERLNYVLGNETIYLDVCKYGNSDLVFLNLHENEQTSVLAAKEILKNESGILLELKSRKERLISFTKGEELYIFDPNRMFSVAGIKCSLEEYSTYEPQIANEILLFAKWILKEISEHEPRWLVALHNTSGDYSIEGYLKGASYEKDAADLFVNAKRHKGDFFFTSDREAFIKIRNSGFNVVFQNNDLVIDDGSLSVYCGQNGIPYINIEALHGHLEQQMEMVEFICNGFLS